MLKHELDWLKSTTSLVGDQTGSVVVVVESGHVPRSIPLGIGVGEINWSLFLDVDGIIAKQLATKSAKAREFWRSLATAFCQLATELREELTKV